MIGVVASHAAFVTLCSSYHNTFNIWLKTYQKEEVYTKKAVCLLLVLPEVANRKGLQQCAASFPFPAERLHQVPTVQ